MRKMILAAAALLLAATAMAAVKRSGTVPQVLTTVSLGTATQCDVVYYNPGAAAVTVDIKTSSGTVLDSTVVPSSAPALASQLAVNDSWNVQVQASGAGVRYYLYCR